ncbi:DUF4238 domain-containing protein [Hymenobacter guriensis]|uniref:DUF4238 domain-containing protein n=1 Tax=Hymenobacter guriensis TaxID=2793065 RepID=A0ABS0L227_9BACT|nr:DUF4238 domain-containing protein [Hymenobacter guriensis]MBG8554168.1 DUF4238 domain-containing protein [Hymenobacter guriensis]
MSNNSKKHHYLPQFYLRGFVDKKGFFFIYDKELKIFRRSRPEHEFYEKNKNAIDINGERVLLLEHMYSHIESTLAPVISTIEKSGPTDHVLNADVIIRLKFFVEIMRWRNPALDDVYNKIIGRMSIKDFGFSVRGGSEERRAEIEAMMMDHPFVQKTVRPLMAAMGMGELTNVDYDTSKWNILYQDGGFPILGDFPIIFNPNSINKIFEGDFILPLSAQRTIVYSQVPRVKQLPDSFSIDKDLMQMHLAKRFVCCKHESYLRFMVNFYALNKSAIDDGYIQNMFSVLSKGV